MSGWLGFEWELTRPHTVYHMYQFMSIVSINPIRAVLMIYASTSYVLPLTVYTVSIYMVESTISDYAKPQGPSLSASHRAHRSYDISGETNMELSFSLTSPPAHQPA